MSITRGEVLTGNELTSGATVYLDARGNWVDTIAAARVFSEEDGEAKTAAMEATKATGRIVSLEAETVSVNDGEIVPDRLRERIRAAGPTAPVFDRQHLDEDGHVSI
ncbi:hypothetical protein GCM10007989_07000 [Devosia pacifica]|uniref:DUF2849 domain-containing protein n=1 Tax=Devosia pacifica TaxID=1335967 RepID=A0A918RX76_9HYPH|nr:DUF2849 domain-containing protein [Devosia pacifica]GHA14891.1 hypothetical protein GCM10007989_07000 [Devosia pacifica]